MEEQNRINEMTMRDYVGVLFRHRVVILTTIITVMTTVIIGVLLKTPMYQAQVKMLLTGQKRAQAAYYADIGLGAARSSMQIMLTQKEIVTSDPVLERAVSVSGLAKKSLDYEKKFCSPLKRPLVDLQVRRLTKQLDKFTKEQKDAYLFRLGMEYLRASIKVEPVRDTDLILIQVRDYNPLAAAVMANIVSRSYVIFDLEQQMAEMELKFGEKNLAVIQLKEAIDKMSKSLNGAPLPSIEAIGPATVKIIEQAKVPFRPAGVPRLLTVILAFFLSVFLSVMFAFSFEYMDQTIKSARDAEALLGIDCLGSLSRKAKGGDYQALSEQLYLVMKDKSVKVLLFASAMPNEGVTTVLANLGAYLAENLQQKVLLIDGNLRQPFLHKTFNLAESKNFVQVIEGRMPLDQGVQVISRNLHVLTSGSSTLNPIPVLESPMMRDLLKQAKGSYDVVLMDSAPIRKFKDTGIVSALVDGVIIVVNVQATRRYVVKNAVESLFAIKANILGFFLNNRKFVIPKMLYDRM